ncbi:unnamed protein product [Protopolystoma xenopodis]|uniref:Uncharacterized protein n=1 Tax=Protopolystoma xenopodis TaxID=117903 RepID=A0A3S5CQT8_9PLAT|nr:unnamed protein product [Protopolystoma xenopodis]
MVFGSVERGLLDRFVSSTRSPFGGLRTRRHSLLLALALALAFSLSLSLSLALVSASALASTYAAFASAALVPSPKPDQQNDRPTPFRPLLTPLRLPSSNALVSPSIHCSALHSTPFTSKLAATSIHADTHTHGALTWPSFNRPLSTSTQLAIDSPACPASSSPSHRASLTPSAPISRLAVAHVQMDTAKGLLALSRRQEDGARVAGPTCYCRRSATRAPAPHPPSPHLHC